jgi:hypothetical protein
MKASSIPLERHGWLFVSGVCEGVRRTAPKNVQRIATKERRSGAFGRWIGGDFEIQIKIVFRRMTRDI